MKGEQQSLKTELAHSKSIIKAVQAENIQLQRELNLGNFKLDSIKQYEGRKNIQIHNASEMRSNKDDEEEKVLMSAKELNISVNYADIQRAYRLGKKKINGKPRPIIIRFQPFKKCSKFLLRKSDLKSSNEFKNIFVAEYLTPIPTKLLRCLKNESDSKPIYVHNLSGLTRKI